MKLNEIRTTNILLIIIIIPIIFYLLKILSFIFIPLTAAMFISLLFLPLMRWFNKKNVPKFISITTVVLIILGVFKIGGVLIEVSSNELLSMGDDFLTKAEVKINNLIGSLEGFMGIGSLKENSSLANYISNDSFFKNTGVIFKMATSIVSSSLVTAFFVVLLLAGSINIEQLLNKTIFKINYSSIKTFRKIEKDIIKFVIVKFIVSFLTGVGFTLACIAFDVSFPIFWGLLAFLINFVQMIGSVVSVILLSVFGFIEIDTTSTLIYFILSITGVQVLFGSIIEPVFMGKTFSVNVITILIMLMLWGYIWGVPGMIMSIPITVFIKILLDQFPKYHVISSLMSGDTPKQK